MDAWLGTILPVGFDYAPDGWALARGQPLAVNQYQALYSIFGTRYGGDTSAFGMPDLQGRVPLGYGQRTGPWGTIPYALGAKGGSEYAQINNINLPLHTHPAQFLPVKSNVTVTIPAQQGNLTVSPKWKASSANGDHQTPQTNDMIGASTSTASKPYTATSTNPVDLTGVSVTVSGSASTPAISTTINNLLVGGSVSVDYGGGVAAPQPVDVRMPYLAINFIVCLYGIYPVKP